MTMATNGKPTVLFPKGTARASDASGKAPAGNDKAPRTGKSGRTKAARRRRKLEQQVTAQMASMAVSAGRWRARHVMTLISFLLLVAAPVGGAAWYLWTQAADQFASEAGFAVRHEDSLPAIQGLGGMAAISANSVSESEILFAFLNSQTVVDRIDAAVDLRAIWSGATGDPVFAFDPTGTAEDLRRTWRQMVKVRHDRATGLIDLRVQAFTAQDAQSIARAIEVESGKIVRSLSDEAQMDAVEFARMDLDAASERLKQTRLAVTRFRNRVQTVDPSADIRTQAGLLTSLKMKLTEARIEHDMLTVTTRSGDPRLLQSQRAIEVLLAQIEVEKRRLGFEGDGETALADLVGEYEVLLVERDVAEQGYVAALRSYDLAVADARRVTRYLATYAPPSLAERAEYPRKWLLLGGLAAFLVMGWGVLLLLFYGVRDRR